MAVVETLTSRNACVDPNAVLGVAPGEVGTIRNVGGRVTPGLLRKW